MRRTYLDTYYEVVLSVRGPVSDGELIERIAPPWLSICREIQRNATFLYEYAPIIFSVFSAPP
jgi:hypothetical protein